MEQTGPDQDTNLWNGLKWNGGGEVETIIVDQLLAIKLASFPGVA